MCVNKKLRVYDIIQYSLLVSAAVDIQTLLLGMDPVRMMYRQSHIIYTV